jgi:hypothetical protein
MLGKSILNDKPPACPITHLIPMFPKLACFLIPCLWLCGARLSLALTEAEIQGFINEAIKAGGGEVLIPPGVHLIEKGLVLKDAKKIRLVGFDMEACVLKLPPLAFAETAEAVKAGADRIATKRQQHLKPGMQLHIEAEGEMDSFTKKPKPYVLAVVKEIAKDAILLEKPLSHPVPAGTMIRDANAPNLIELRGACEEVRIEKLTLDGGRVEGDPQVRGHAQLCGVLAAGDYTYEKGPTGPKPRAIAVSRCIIRHCHGRGVAFYSVDESSVEDCTIMDTTDEAVDLDHFTTKTTVRHNHIARSLVGVELNDANDCLVSANEFRDCKTGINLWQWCKQPGLNEGNRIENNLFLNTGGNAVRIQEGLTKNVVEGNEEGR